MEMFDNKTTHIISIIDSYLQSIGFDTQLLGYANIKKYPDKKALVSLLLQKVTQQEFDMLF